MIKTLIGLLRPHQWTKNLFCFAGIVFGTHLLTRDNFVNAALVFAGFCCASSATYVLNDIRDVELDRAHPKKRERSIASGRISVLAAAIVGWGLVLASGFLVWLSGWLPTTCLLLYFGLNVAYSLGLKHLVVVDVFSIALGFIFRLLAGIYALRDIPTGWIMLCTLFLALFLGFAKRRSELSDLTGERPSQRPVLSKYRIEYLDSLVNSTATMTILSYALFTLTSGKNPTLVVTVPIVCYAIMRYKLLVMVRAGAQEPERLLVLDPGIQLSVVAWLVAFLVITYGNIHLFR